MDKRILRDEKVENLQVKTVDGLTVNGKFNLDSEGIDRARMSDTLNEGKNPFLALFEVRQGATEFPVVLLRKEKIITVRPSDSQNVQSDLKKDPRAESVIVKTIDGKTIKGKYNLDSEGVPADRLSDALQKGQNPFMIVFESLEAGQKFQVILIRKENIISISPDK